MKIRLRQRPYENDPVGALTDMDVQDVKILTSEAGDYSQGLLVEDIDRVGSTRRFRLTATHGRLEIVPQANNSIVLRVVR